MMRGGELVGLRPSSPWGLLNARLVYVLGPLFAAVALAIAPFSSRPVQLIVIGIGLLALTAFAALFMRFVRRRTGGQGGYKVKR